MTSTEIQTVAGFEDGLKLGHKVRVRWTNSHKFYDGLGTIAKINAKSFRVALSEPVDSQIGLSSYPVGHMILVPRFTTRTDWSLNNRVEPEGEYQ